jgi:hypothetical protein
MRIEGVGAPCLEGDLHTVAEPVGCGVDVDLTIIDMGVFGAAFFGREDVDGLALRVPQPLVAAQNAWHPFRNLETIPRRNALSV